MTTPNIGAIFHRAMVKAADERIAQSIAAATETILHGMEIMSAEERLQVFDALRGKYCLHCGDADPRCPCQNDE